MNRKEVFTLAIICAIINFVVSMYVFDRELAHNLYFASMGFTISIMTSIVLNHLNKKEND